MKDSLATIILKLVLYTLVTTSLHAQTNAGFSEKIGIENGLSSNYANNVLQDSKGFIWIGTNNGLNRYDGYQAKVFKYDANDNNSISDNLITSLLEDSNGNIWIGTSGGGVNRYNSVTGEITRFTHKDNDPTSISSNVILQIYEDSSSRLWVGTKNGLNLLDRSTMTFQSWLQPNECETCKYSVKSIVEDNKGNLWIGDEFYGLYYFTPLTGKFTKPHLKYSGKNRLPSSFIHDLVFSKGILWVGTDNGVVLLNTLTQSYENIELDDSSDKRFIDDVYVWSLYKDDDGDIWICTNGNGLVHYKPETKKISVYRSEGKSDYKIGTNLVQDVTLDTSKNIWIATRGDGVNKFNLKNLVFSHWENDTENSNSLVNNDVRAMLQESDDTIWLGTSNGLSKFNPITNVYKNYIKDFNYKADAKTPKIRAIYRSKSNDLWVATQGGALYVYDEKQDRFTLAKSFLNNALANEIRHIEIIYEAEEGVLWLGTIGTGILAYNTVTQEFEKIYPKNGPNEILLNLYVNCVLKHSETEVWIGSNRGLILLNTRTLTFKLWVYKEGCDNCVIGNKIRSLYRGIDNKIWVGTRSGLAIFDPKSEQFEQYGINDGLPSDVIYGILPGADDHIWLTTPNGLSRINPASMDFKNVTIPRNNILDMGGHALGVDETLLVGGTTGFSIFNPKDIKINRYLPNVVFTDIAVNNQSSSFKKNVSELKELNLSYNQNNLTFEFSGLEFTNSKLNKYKYKLDGFNDEWVEHGSKHDLTFTNLDPRSYVLKIKGANNEGVWNENETSLIINIKPPWWGTLWFKILSVFIFLGSIFIIYYLRIKRIRKTEILLRKEVAKQTDRYLALNRQLKVANDEIANQNKELEQRDQTKNRFFTMISHDVKQPLQSIENLLGLLQLEKTDDPSLDSLFDAIRKSTRNTVTLLNNLLRWALSQTGDLNYNPVPLNLSKVMNEVIPLVDQQAAGKSIVIIQKFDEEVFFNGDADMIKTVLRNLISNAIKFTEENGKVVITSTIQESEIHILIHDDGIGMKPELTASLFQLGETVSRKGTEGEIGTGLGLILCKDFIEKHHRGRMEVDSTLGEGTTFTVVLPIDRM